VFYIATLPPYKALAALCYSNCPRKLIHGYKGKIFAPAYAVSAENVGGVAPFRRLGCGRCAVLSKTIPHCLLGGCCAVGDGFIRPEVCTLVNSRTDNVH